MNKVTEPNVIKKYSNRRLYDTGKSTYVTLEDLAEMIKREEDFVVVDAKTREDITRSVLTQIIVEQENKGQYLLPISFLRQLIRFYGDSMQGLVPNYLEFSLDSLVKEQDNFRNQLSNTLGNGAMGLIEGQVRQNTKMFEQALQLFSPLSILENAKKVEPESDENNSEKQKNNLENSELEALQKQLSEMQKKIDQFSKNKK